MPSTLEERKLLPFLSSSHIFRKETFCISVKSVFKIEVKWESKRILEITKLKDKAERKENKQREEEREARKRAQRIENREREGGSLHETKGKKN